MVRWINLHGGDIKKKRISFGDMHTEMAEWKAGGCGQERWNVKILLHDRNMKSYSYFCMFQNIQIL